MSAYAIGNLTIHKTEWQEEYGQKVPALIKKYGGKILAKAPPQRLEGEPQLATAAIVLEFPSLSRAKAWYDDPEHLEMVALRQTGADFDLVLVEGLPG